MRGNVINDSLHSFVYNRANQLVEATGAASTNSYLYDGHNRRVQTDDTNGTSISIYDSNGKLRYVETNGQVVNYVYLGDRLIAKDGFVTDRKPVQHFRPYGASVEGEINDVGFTGHKFDTSLGLSYMQARYYDPVIGRFYSNDPIGFRDVHSFNRYAYANNNPYKYVDPTGESAVGALTTFIAADAATPEPTDAAIIPKALGYTILLGGAIAIDAVFNESPDDIVVDVLDGKVPTGKPGEYIGDPADLESDLEALTGGDTKQYPNGTRVGQMEDGSTVEQHGSSGKGSDGNKGANVSKGTPTIKVNRPPGTRNITIRYPEIKQESQ
ncbi:MAG: RHS repeat-associated core domain-containing protein [Alteromonadaceae bacterium]|nr:RHS repeat-associated core domain-containing protein [Alteromonadaceae bacterium]